MNDINEFIEPLGVHAMAMEEIGLGVKIKITDGLGFRFSVAEELPFSKYTCIAIRDIIKRELNE